MTPTIGEVVLYNAHDGKSYPAVVGPSATPQQGPGIIDLCSFGPDNAVNFVQNVAQGTGPNTWKLR